MKISRSAVARIWTEKKDKRREKSRPGINDLVELAKIAEDIDKEYCDSLQLEFNFDKDPELKEKSKKAEQEATPSAEKETEKCFISRLQQGEMCNFCGGLMHHLYLQQIGFEDLLSPFSFKIQGELSKLENSWHAFS